MTSPLFDLINKRKHMVYDLVDAETPAEEGERKDLERITDIIRDVLDMDKFIDPSASLRDDLGATHDQYKEIIERVAQAFNMPATEDVLFDVATVQAIYEWTKEKRNTKDDEEKKETEEKKEESAEGFKPKRRRFFAHL